MSPWPDLRQRLQSLDRRTRFAAWAIGALALVALVTGLVRAVPSETPAAGSPQRPEASIRADQGDRSAWKEVDAGGAGALAEPDSGDFAQQLESADAGIAFDSVPAPLDPTPDAETLDCIIEPNETVEIRSPVVGRIEAIYVERSDSVEVGAVLIELESGAERAAVELARARAGQTGSVESRRASLEQSRRRRERAKKLYGEHVLSLENREEMESETRLAELELAQAREVQRLAEYEYRHAERLLERRIIRSPVRGVVVERAMSVGEVVDEETILTVAQLDPLRVEVVLPAAKFGTVKPGMRAAVEPELRSEDVLVASVKLVDRMIDAASGTFRAQLELPNPDQAIPGGLHCRVRFLPE